MRKVAGTIVVLIAVLFIPSQVFAVDYSIESMHIEVFLQENGDAQVTETQVYDFSSSFNGITRTLYAKEGSTITNFKAEENGTNLKVEQEGNLFKIYRSGDSEKITVETHYTINHGVELYTDSGQFYWSFFDDDNESAYDQLDIVVHPPKPTTDVMALGYKSAEETEQILDDGTVHFSFGKVNSGSNASIRVAYDETLFSGMEPTENRPIQGEILSELQKREDKKIAFQKRTDSLKSTAPYVLGFFSVLLLGILLFARQNKQMTIAEVERKYTSPFFVPEEMMSLPATIFYTRGAVYASIEALTVGLLDLVRQKVIKQTDEETFEVIHRNTKYQHEAHLIDWLFYKVGKDGIFNVADLKDYTTNKLYAGVYQGDYQTWRQLVRDEVNENNLYKNYSGFRTIIGILGFSLIPLSVFYGIHDMPLHIFPALGLSIALILFAITFRPRTTKGLKIKQDWDEFVDKYVLLEDKEWDELQDDEQKRAYLYGFGMNSSKINARNEQLLNREPHIQYADPNPMYFLLFATMSNSYFSDAEVSAASTTSSGTSSGIIGGGGGGGIGGSGGGSGAF